MALLRSTIPAEDGFLIKEFKRGKTAAFEELFHRYHGAICYFAKQFVRDTEVAKDIVSETFVKVWNKHEDFDSLGAFKSFLYITTKNACLNHLKQMKVVEEHGKNIAYLQSREESEDLIMNRIFDAEVLGAMNKALETLPNQCRRVLRMSLNGLKTDEIAKNLNISEQTVRNTRVRATVLLKRQLAKDMLWITTCLVALESICHL